MLSKFKLSTKIILGFLTVALILVINGVIGWNGIGTIYSDFYRVAYKTMPEQLSIMTLNKDITNILLAERSLFLVKTNEERDFQNKRLETYWAEIDKKWQYFQGMSLSYDEKALAEKLNELMPRWKESHQQAVKLALAGTPEGLKQGLELSQTEVRKYYLEVESLFNQLTVMKTKEAESFARESDLNAKKIQWLTGIAILVGLIAAIGLGILLGNSISRPIKNIVDALAEDSRQVASASSQLSSASQQLAEGSSEQASAIEETSTTLQETTSMIQQNTENTRQAEMLSKQAREAADQGNLIMSEMSDSMGELKKSSDQIAKIIKVIDEIAFQTNILALNAAVEAARAGEAGMGFAVVAEEVRNLAQRSAQAAKDTAMIIEKNIESAQNGVDISAKVKEALGSIGSQVKKVNELLEEISAASQEQSRGIGQIQKAVKQMETVTMQNAATAEESASASEELNTQAENSQTIVAQLLYLVEGRNNQNQSAVQSGKVKEKALPYIQNPRVRSHAVSDSAVKKVAMEQASRKNNQTANSETVIPLQDDLKDF